MIKLDVQEYCQKCPGFEPIVLKTFKYDETDTIVICERNGNCEWLKGARQYDRRLNGNYD